MSKVPSVQPPQQLLELLGRPYKKRDEILESSNRLVDYSYSLQNCSESELEALQSEIRKELNKVTSNVYELASFLENPQLINATGEITNLLVQTLEEVRLSQKIRDSAARTIRNVLCLLINMSKLKLTPKSFKKAYGIEIGVKDMMTLKGFFEHQQNNY